MAGTPPCSLLAQKKRNIALHQTVEYTHKYVDALGVYTQWQLIDDAPFSREDSL